MKLDGIADKDKTLQRVSQPTTSQKVGNVRAERLPRPERVRGVRNNYDDAEPDRALV